MLSHRPTPSGLVPLQGAKWNDMPLGSSRLSAELIEERLSMVPASGIPIKPDREELRNLRQRQRMESIEKKGTNMTQSHRLESFDDSLPMKGFVEFLDGSGLKTFQNSDLAVLRRRASRHRASIDRFAIRIGTFRNICCTVVAASPNPQCHHYVWCCQHSAQPHWPSYTKWDTGSCFRQDGKEDGASEFFEAGRQKGNRSWY